MTAGTVAVIGEGPQLRGYALAGAVVLAAHGADAVHQAWAALSEQTTLVIVSKSAAAHLTEELAADWPLTAVIPE